MTQNDPLFSSNAAFTGEPTVVGIGKRPTRLIVVEPKHKWRDCVIDRLEELVRLPQGWDGYKAVPVSLLNANFAVRLLESVCSSDSPVPQIVPGTEGDLQIEWHGAAADIELHIRAPNDVVAWHGGDQEVRLTNNFIDVAAWIDDLERTRAAVAAA